MAIHRLWYWGLCFAALLVILTGHTAQAAVMSIDYGTEWFKVGLIKPGIPLDVALNKDSKRKTQSVVTIRGAQRLYGSDALSLAGRFPHSTFLNLKSIAGKPYHDSHCEEYRQRFVNPMQIDPVRQSPVFLFNETEHLSVEELIAYQFQNAKEQASHTAGEEVRDTVITVAPFATQFERQAILDAAHLAGLNVLALIHDETAVALNYAVSRDFAVTPEYHIFYDMGAGSTVASIVSFSTVDVKEGRKTRSAPQLEVKSVGYDRTLGGHEFDVRLQRHLADGFMEKHKQTVKTSIYTADGAMTKLLKEANRIKQVLSANTEVMSSVEGLHEEIDFKMKVSRAELERLTGDLIERVPGPIVSALAAANMTVDDVQSLVLVGGGVRVPAVQNTLASIVGAQKLAKNVNGDEAAVLGAAFRGASLSNQFRLNKDIKIKDVTVFPIEVVYTSEQDDKPVHVTLFNEFGTIGTRKIVTFKRQTDFDFTVRYGGDDKIHPADEIATIKVSGLTDAMEKYKEEIKDAEQPPKVRVVMEMSDSGLWSVEEAHVSIQVTQQGGNTFTDKVKSFFGSKEKASDDDADTNETANTANNNNDTLLQTNETQSEGASASPDPKKETIKVPLTIDTTLAAPLPLSKEQKADAKQRIKRLDALDLKQRLREEGRNTLESFVYKLQDFLYDDTFVMVSTETEQEELRSQLSETSDWLYEDGEHADVVAYQQRLEKLRSLETPISFRQTEYLKRNNTIERLRSSVKLARDMADLFLRTPEEERYHTPEEIESVQVLADKIEEWGNTTVAAQTALALHLDPVLTSAQVETKCRPLDEAVMKLLVKKKPKKPVVPKDNTTTDPEKGSSDASDVPPADGSSSSDEDTLPKELKDESKDTPKTSNDTENEDRRHDEL